MESSKSNTHNQHQPEAVRSQSKQKTYRYKLLHFLGQWSTKKVVIVAGAALLIGSGSFLVYQFSNSDRPGYRTVLPGDKSIDELGGWKRVSPPEKDPVYAYADKIDNVPITVSQQPLPDSFKNETARQVAELAKSYNATTKITADNTTIFIGTSSKGPQSVILTKKDVLILIKSQKAIENTAWEDYVKSLGNPGSGRIPKY